MRRSLRIAELKERRNAAAAARRRRMELVPLPRSHAMAAHDFQPYQLTKVDYKRINMFPKPRSGHRIVCNETDIFCFGGFNSSPSTGNYILFQEFWRFNTFTMKWTLVFGPRDEATLPTELASHSMCMHGDSVLIFGGTGYPFGSSCSNRLFIVQPYRKPDATIVELQTTGDAPLPLYGQSIVVHRDYLYVVGGTTGLYYTCDVHRLHLQTAVWEVVSVCRSENKNDPKGRYRHEIVADENNIYVIGGGTSSTTYSLDYVSTFNFRSRTWSKVETLPDVRAPAPGVPEARMCHSCVRQQGSNGDFEVVMAGGTFGDMRFFNDIWVLNLRTMRWRMLPFELAHPLHFHDAASIGNGQMYLFGGIEKTDGAPLRTNYVYKVWLKVPTLAEMCWEAMLTIRPLLPLVGADALIRSGVPAQFVRRLRLPTPADT